MQKSEFSDGVGISNFVSELYDWHLVNVYDLIKAATDFLDDNYRGLITTCAHITSEERIEISDYYLIKLFKKLVSISNFKKLVNVNFYCDNLTFSINFAYSDGMSFDKRDERELIKLARRAGFEAVRGESGLLISKEVFEPTVIAVFAKPIEISRIMENFGIIFYDE